MNCLVKIPRMIEVARPMMRKGGAISQALSPRWLVAKVGSRHELPAGKDKRVGRLTGAD